MFDLQTAVTQAKYVTFMTGAGVSTASGIPDYRSKGGLYADKVDPSTRFPLIICRHIMKIFMNSS